MDHLSQISTVYDCDKESPQRILHSSSIRNTLSRFFPLSTELPAVKWATWGEKGQQLSIYLLCQHRANGVKFFYEMVSRWLLPGKRLNIPSFFATDFVLEEFAEGVLTLCEVVISLESSEVFNQLPILESEIRMGLTSVYHANRILEIKGLSADEKTALIQGRIASFLERRPKHFDHDIFAQMQHFLVMCGEEFKSVRDHAHMSRIICAFYLFRKALKRQMETHPGHRFVYVKTSPAYLHLAFGVRKVLALFIALNYVEENELFEERHALSVLQRQFPELNVIENSFFSRTIKEERIQLLCLEVEKEDFTLEEVKWLRKQLPDEIKKGVEKLAHQLFMPRNEEEIMRNMITLSKQLQFVKDLPQVIVSFDGQMGEELMYTVIWLRILRDGDCPLQSLFEGNTFLKFIPDRVREVGVLRKKFVKEANVFQITFSAHRFLRADHSVDLFEARRAIVAELGRVLGEFRDYNGGMIAKQHELLMALKELLNPLEKNEQLLLEDFFHSIMPMEMRCLCNPLYLKKLFLMLLKGEKEAVADEGCYFWGVEAVHASDSQILTVELEYLGVRYFGGLCSVEEVLTPLNV